MVKERLVKFPPEVAEANRETWLSDTILKVFNSSRGVLAKFIEYPGIFDRDDIESEFLIGVHDGLCRVDWTKGNPMIYLMRSGLWRMRTYRYRALKKRAVAVCTGCGKALGWNEQPCHTPEGLPSTLVSIPVALGADLTTPGAKEYHVVMRDRLVYMSEMATDQIERYMGGNDESDDEGMS